MKILQLYSNHPQFKHVKFNEHFNVILGDIKYEKDFDKDSHNLGKSILINLIDFMLLKSIDKNHFLKKTPFESHIFFMELKLNSGKYITIKRAALNNTKISFKIHDILYQNYINESNWDYEYLALDAAVQILNEFLSFEVLPEYPYRKTSNYFFRTQYDYSNIFKLKKFGGQDIDWKPILFELLGFSDKFMIEKYNFDDEKKKKNKLIGDISHEFKMSAENTDRIKGLIEIKTGERNEIRKWLDKFDFYAQDNKVEKDVILKIEEEISQLNNEKYNIDYEINEITKSLKQNISYDLEKIQKLYSEVKIILPELLVKEYEELIAFNEKVFNERKKYLMEILDIKNPRLIKIEKQLRELNQSRKDNMAAFTQSETFEKYNMYRNSLIETEKELIKYITELDNADVIKKLKNEILNIDMQINNTVSNLRKQIDSVNNNYRHIRKNFHEFVKKVINHESVISLPINKSNNVDFTVEILDHKNIATSQTEGYTYKKILCACFDLAVIENYINRSFYKTVYHDGCLESLDQRKQRKYWDLIKDSSKTHNIQYILTALKSDIPKDDEGNLLLQEHEIAVTLSDEDDNKGRLFGFAF